MKKLLIFVTIVAWMMTNGLTVDAQNVTTTRENNKITIVEETPTEEGTIVTTTIMDKDSIFVSGLFQNWELSIAAGPHMYLGENDWKVRKKAEMIAFPAIDIYLTKWVSPTFGFGIGSTTGRFKGLYQSNPSRWENNFVAANYQTGKLYYDKNSEPWGYQWIAEQRSWFTSLYALAHVDMINLFGGYNPNRVYGLDLYAGGGLMLGFNPGEVIPGVSFNAGLINRFRISDHISLTLGVRGAMIGDDFDGERFTQEPDQEHRAANFKMDGNIGVTAGINISLGGSRKWRTGQRTTRLIPKTVRDTVTIREPAVAPVPVGVVAVENQTDTLLVKQFPEVWFHVNFDVNKWEIKSRELVNLQAVADLIKSTPEIRYLICGYADKQTATPEHNQMLSEKRSQAVYDVLVEQFGINPAQLVRDAKGGVDYMFYNEKELSRCVMITAIQE